MCNIWQEKNLKDLSLDEIKNMLADPVFESVEYVVLSGGEPTLRDDFSSIARLFAENCPSLRGIALPTNGLITKRVINACHALNDVCKEFNVSFSISVSLDGINEVHGRVRGIPDAFERTVETIDALRALNQKFNFGLNAHCVVSSANVFGLSDLQKWCDQRNLSLSFELAHDWARFLNETSSFHLTEKQKRVFLNDLWTQVKAPNGYEYDWMCYRMISSGKKRHLSCPFLVNAFSVNYDGKVYYCPGAKAIGNVRGDSLSDIYYNKENLKYRKWVGKNLCASCTQSLWCYVPENNLIRHMQHRLVKRVMALIR